MKQLYVQQKLFSVGEKFTITDHQQNICYYVEGSLFNVQKHFEIQNAAHQTVATITKKILAVFPKFIVETSNHFQVEIKKDFSLLKPHYTFSPAKIQVEGDIFEMNFSILSASQEIAQIHKKWFSWGDSYEISILAPEQPVVTDQEELIVALVIAIDYINFQERASRSGG